MWMLRRSALGFVFVLLAAVAIVACSSSDATQSISVGPNFAPGTLYLANPSQNALEIYPPGTTGGSGPKYDIAGSNTSMSGPQSVAFDSAKDAYVTNWDPSTSTGSISEYKTYATGNVLAIGLLSLNSIRPRGIYGFQVIFSGTTTPTDVLAVAAADPTQPSTFVNRILFYEASSLTTAYQILSGPSTGLNVPSGVAVDKNDNIYVANLQGSSVEEFALPTPTPTPKPTATPSPTPTPKPTPTGATASPSPTPSPTASPVNVAPQITLTNGVGKPTGVALDQAGNIYVSDQASTVCTPACPAVLIFAAGSNGATVPKAIAGSNTTLNAPTDVKVDSSGKIYVADTSSSGAGTIKVFAPGASGNVAPTATFTSPGTSMGLGILP
jgi:hypothetical protein